MAGYREHISVSGLLGVGYGVVATFVCGFTPVQAGIAGCLAWVAGMLPDLDSQTGKPVREVFSLLAAVTPMLMMRRITEWGGDAEGAILVTIVVYAAIRYGGAFLMGKLAVHRGMFHSLPMLFIATLLTFLAYKSDAIAVRLLMAVAVAVGFASHLVLDEVYSVAWSGVKLKLNQAAGSAMKLAGKKFLPNLLTYAVLSGLVYFTMVDVGYLHGPGPKQVPGMLQHAVDDGRVLR